MNMARFVKKELPDGIRGRFRLSSKIQLSCIEEALDRLAEAEEYGGKLDGIYNEALDEKKLEAFAGELEEELEFRLMHK